MTHPAFARAPRLSALVVLALIGSGPVAQADEAAPASGPKADQAAPAPDPQGVIRRQLDDFAKDDAADAFAQAAPQIQQRFADPDAFVAMVKSAYPAVYRHHSVQFGDGSRDGDEARQSVTFVDNGNQVWNAVYILARQADGNWRIVGCVMAQSDDTSL